MRIALDSTHDPALRSWVASAKAHPDFPIQNLPFGVARGHDFAAQGCVAIGDQVLLLSSLAAAGILNGLAQRACEAAAEAQLNRFLAMGTEARVALRRALSALLAEGEQQRPELLRPGSECALLLPASIGDYTDFYAGIVHAENVGKLFRPDNPLLRNYKWVPIGYHGRASSVRVSGEDVRRPHGQRLTGDQPRFEQTAKLDYELELGIWVGRGNALGEPVAVADAGDAIAGYCLLNDWSARDLQAWEYQPLGPFLGKSFHTTISPWVVTPEALAPFRAAQPQSEPKPLPYLYAEEDQRSGALSIALEAWLTTPSLPEGVCLTQTDTSALFWTPAQLVAHHTSNGCNLRNGDLFGTGTISSDSGNGAGSLLERTFNGTEPLQLPNGETRTFLEDGDEITLRAQARREGFVSIGFGECRARILPAK